jgi:hypothetical protein
VSTRVVNYWHHACAEGGANALASKGPISPDCFLTDQQRGLCQILRHSANDYGFATQGRTLAASGG